MNIVERVKPDGHHRAVRRPDAAQPGRRPARGRRAADRHLGRVDRPRRGPRAVHRRSCASSACASPRTASRVDGRRGLRDRAPHRLPGARAAELRARRARDGDRLRRRRARRATCRTPCRPRPTARSWSTSSSRTRSRSTSTRSRDGELVVIGGVMEHIEEAGIHSGDSTCVLPPHTLDRGDRRTRSRARRRPWPRSSASSA